MLNDLWSKLNAKAGVPSVPTNHTSIWNLDPWMLWLMTTECNKKKLLRRTTSSVAVKISTSIGSCFFHSIATSSPNVPKTRQQDNKSWKSMKIDPSDKHFPSRLSFAPSYWSKDTTFQTVRMQRTLDARPPVRTFFLQKNMTGSQARLWVWVYSGMIYTSICI